MIPINVDRNVGPASYRQLTEAGQLLVTSIFYTIQGEGPYTGHPAVFLRLAGCNLGAKRECPWCDTRFNFDEGKAMTLGEVTNAILPYLDRARLIVVTGGEPLLQWPVLSKLIEGFNDGMQRPPHWQFETNGVFLDSGLLAEAEHLGHTSFVVSPKIIGDSYRPLTDEWPAFGSMLTLKYVVSSDSLSPYRRLPDDLLSWAKRHGMTVYLSGQTEYGPEDEPTTPGAPASMRTLSREGRWATLRNWEYAAQLALRHGFRVSFQTHLLAGVE